MFVQYSFAQKHDYPDFKSQPRSADSPSAFVVGILAMIATTIVYLLS